MDELINYLLRFGHLNPQQIALIKSKATEITLQKGDYFSEAGKIPKQVGFNINGVLRVCFYSRDGNEFTRYFMPENRFVVDYNSFINEIPSAEYVEALTNCRIVVLSKPAFHELANTIIEWNPIITKIMSAAMVQKITDAGQMMAEDGKTRYLNFLERMPGLANRIPLSALASYLGVTQSSLSRIRKNV